MPTPLEDGASAVARRRVTLSRLLALVGRLDDTPGFDTPRERYRRYLLEHAGDTHALCELVEEGQYTLGEQHRRGLQDAVVVLGRSLGFDTAFGSYEGVAGRLTPGGQWQSRSHVTIALDFRVATADTTGIILERLKRSLMAPRSSAASTAQTYGLCIVTPLFGDPDALEAAISADDSPGEVRVVSLCSLLWMSRATEAGMLRHEEVVHLLTDPPGADFVVDLISRLSNEPRAESQGPSATGATRAHFAAPMRPPAAPLDAIPLTLSADDGPDRQLHWVARIDSDDVTNAQQVVDCVIAKRHLLGIEASPTSERPRPQDWVCFLVKGRGIVGHAQVDSIAHAPAPLRDAHRFTAVFVLKNVIVYDTPVAILPAAAEWHAARAHDSEEGAALALVSAEDFAERTRGWANERSEWRSAS